ncbi:MAG: UDP-2,3-diacylglucosamine diphosphatase [Planctomycetota bacterium]
MVSTTATLQTARSAESQRRSGERTTYRARTARTVFVSDLHLGIRQSNIDAFVVFLQYHQPRHLYLVGDFLDARALRMTRRWQPSWNVVLETIAELIDNGTRVAYTPGNHDDYLRHIEIRDCDISIADEFLHRTVDGRRVAVLHGDQFDEVEHRAHWLSMVGSIAYTILLAIDRAMNRVLVAAGFRPRRLSRFLKQNCKRLVQWFSGFERRVDTHARDRGCDVIVCGHIHIPAVRRFDDQILYFNLGDWIENATGLVEYGDGELELVDMERDRHGYAAVFDRMLSSSKPATLSRRARSIRDALCEGLPFVEFADE